MTKLVINFPGGAGGSWLSNLVYFLEYNIPPPPHTAPHFHKVAKSTSISITHTLVGENVVFFNGTALFNIYLNVAQKLRIVDQKLHLKSIVEQIKILELEAGSKIMYKDKRIDLNYNYLFSKPYQFIEQLFYILDLADISYTKNINYCLTAIDNFKKTCVDPRLHFDNFDSLLWIGWCAGITQRELIYLSDICSIDNAKELMLPNRDFFVEYTQSLMIPLQ